MARIIQFDSSGNKPGKGSPANTQHCGHKQVTAYTVYRTVRCTVCGADLDPFDVLVDMFKAYVPPGKSDQEEKRLLREVDKRNGKKS